MATEHPDERCDLSGNSSYNSVLIFGVIKEIPSSVTSLICNFLLANLSQQGYNNITLWHLCQILNSLFSVLSYKLSNLYACSIQKVVIICLKKEI